jgi:hypothetical protein
VSTTEAARPSVSVESDRKEAITMTRHLTVLADQDRVELFALLRQSRRLFQEAQPWTDSNGIAWLGTQVGTLGIGLTWLGPGWVFDAQAQHERAEEHEQRLHDMLQADDGHHLGKLDEAVDALRRCRHAERLLWAVHAAVREHATSSLILSDHWLGEMVWGRQRPPALRHWRGELIRTLRSLALLHVSPWPEDGLPAFGEGTALLNHVGDLRGLDDECEGHCPERPGRHHHVQVEIGPAFLGLLEAFGKLDPETGIRSYTFPRGGPRSAGPSLWKAGKTGRLVSVFLPAKLGEPDLCNRLSPAQHRLLQALVRETTRAAKKKRSKDAAEAEIITDNKVPDYSSFERINGPFPNSVDGHVGFNGNGNRKRKGRGYRLASENGWLARAGYPLDGAEAFLDDLAALAALLGLVVVGIGRKCRFVALERMRAMAASQADRHALKRLHVRVYTASDYLERWSGVFLGDQPDSEHLPGDDNSDAIASVVAAINTKKIPRRKLAKGAGVDPSLLSKLLNGKKPWPKRILEKVQKWIAAQMAPLPKPRTAGHSREPKKSRADDLLDEALRLLNRGWSVVPQRPGEKKPCVRWKPYQTQLPTEQELREWFERWPDAGLALVLGPVSGVFVIDTDGEEAHKVLLERLGKEPLAPKALSGSGEPRRYHLYFKCPDLLTKAKQTPWHPKLEFRGKGGIVVIPPSLHKSGKRYAWAKGRSPDEMELPPVPKQVLEALKPLRPVRNPSCARVRIKPVAGIEASPRTLEFLSGKWAEGPRWNDKLFNAACDLCGLDMPLEEAEPLLLAGAQPWNVGEEELARRTIASAYSQPREPARL